MCWEKIEFWQTLLFVLSGSISLLFPLPFSQQISPRLFIQTINGLGLHGHQCLGISGQRIHLVNRLALASIGGQVAELLGDVSVDLVLGLVMSLHGVLTSTGVLQYYSTTGLLT